jgi:oligopeptide/dipeptide ABC transporter ATP-binding protein
MAGLIEIENLTVAFNGEQRVIDQASLEIPADSWTGLVGESGSGKSTTALAILGLLPASARVLGGRILLDGENLLEMGPKGLRQVRGRQIGMIFQNPRSALNPLLTVGAQIARAAKRGGVSDPRAAVLDLLRRVQIPDPKRVASVYPHQISGGMCQRVLIAMMLALRPKLLIADEPTTALDVTVQAEILSLIHEVQQEMSSAVLLISHDLGVIAEHCQNVAVMYRGHVVESAPTGTLFGDPQHPYTAHLMSTILRVDKSVDLDTPENRSDANTLGSTGCPYAPRCPHSEARCVAGRVPLEKVGPDHVVACVRHGELSGLSVEAKGLGVA